MTSPASPRSKPKTRARSPARPDSRGRGKASRTRSHLSRLHDRILASSGRGKETALAFVDALLRSTKRGPVVVEGRWSKVFEAMGRPQNSDKTALAALHLLTKLTPMVTRTSPKGHTWRLDTTAIDDDAGHEGPGAEVGHLDRGATTAENGHEPIDTKPDTKVGHLGPGKSDTKVRHPRATDRTPQATRKPAASTRRLAETSRSASLARARGDLDGDETEQHGEFDGGKAGQHDDFGQPLVGPFVESLVTHGVPAVGAVRFVTLTVRQGLGLVDIGQRFAALYEGADAGTWLVHQRSFTDHLHFHGLVVTVKPDEILPRWHACGGDSESKAQRSDAIDTTDPHTHLRRVVAYTMRSMPVPPHGTMPREAIASGVLARPWTAACNGRGADVAVVSEPFTTSIPSRLPPAPDIDDHAWVVEVQSWPPDTRQALAERAEVYRRLGRGDGRQRDYWGYRALRGMVGTPSAFPRHLQAHQQAVMHSL